MHKAGTLPIEDKTNQSGGIGLGELSRHFGDGDWTSHARRTPQHGFSDFSDVEQAGTASGDDETGAAEIERSTVAQVIADQFEQFARAGLQNFAKEPL